MKKVEPFHYIPDWWEKSLTCACCGETRSVKYIFRSKYFCNSCMLPIHLKAIEIANKTE